MFGFLISGEVNDDAVALKKLTDMAINKYADLHDKQLDEAISHNFDESHRSIEARNINFVFNELEDFLFSLDISPSESATHNLSIFGRGKYAGFLLQVGEGSNWQCSASDGAAYRATGGARKLVKVLIKKYGITDFSGYINAHR